jgi:hypothetical protein
MYKVALLTLALIPLVSFGVAVLGVVRYKLQRG